MGAMEAEFNRLVQEDFKDNILAFVDYFHQEIMSSGIKTQLNLAVLY